MTGDNVVGDGAFPRRVAVLGSSGSIGQSAMEVIAQSEGKLVPVLLSVHSRTDILVEQIHQIRQHSPLPRWAVITDETADRSPLQELPAGIDLYFGNEKLCEMVQHPEVDTVLSAIVGSAGLTSTFAALESGKTVALANKEALVMGGKLLIDLVKSGSGSLLPVDSEHSAIMQTLRSWTLKSGALTSGKRNREEIQPSADGSRNMAESVNMAESIEKVILTASGGPFRTLPLSALASVSVEDALAHPTWKMGKKITIDSATLMNKALEMIEAGWLFDLPREKIDVVIHPQSLVHSMVEFVDGSIIAQMSPPDMRLPIQLALLYPHRYHGSSLKWDWQTMHTLEFYPPDLERFPAIALAWNVIDSGGTAGAVLNAANETAVAAFLGGRLSFHHIVKVCESVLACHTFDPNPTLRQLLSIDQWSRQEAEKRIKSM